MPRSRLTAVVLVIAAIALATVLPASPQEQLPEAIQAIVDGWKRCVQRSFTVQLRSTADRDLAAEIAFQACATEEQAVKYAFENHCGNCVAHVMIVARVNLKRSMVGGQP